MLKKTYWFAFLLVFLIALPSFGAEKVTVDNIQRITLPYDWSGIEIMGVSAEGIRFQNPGTGEVSLMDLDGKLQFTLPGALDEYSEGLAPYYLLFGAEGYMTQNGKFALPPIYEVAYPFSEGLAEVKMNGQSGIIDKTGRLVYLLPEGEYMTEFHDGVMWMVHFGEGEKPTCTLLDQSFTPLFKTDRFSEIGAYQNGAAVAFDRENDLWCILDKSGEILFETKRENPEEGTVTLYDECFYNGRLLRTTAQEADGQILSVELVNKNGKVLSRYEGDCSEIEWVSVFDKTHVVAETSDGRLLFLNEKLSPASVFSLEGWELSIQNGAYMVLLASDRQSALVLKGKPEEAVATPLSAPKYLDFPEASLPQVKLQIGQAEVMIDSDAQTLTAPPVLKDGRTLVPVRALENMMNCLVTWNARDKTVTLDGAKKVVLTIGESTARVTSYHMDTNKYVTVNEPLDAAAEIIDGSTYVPLRFIAECFGYEVSWEDGMVTLTPDTQSVQAFYREFVNIYGTPKSN